MNINNHGPRTGRAMGEKEDVINEASILKTQLGGYGANHVCRCI